VELDAQMAEIGTEQAGLEAQIAELRQKLGACPSILQDCRNDWNKNDT
jgi:hypothetical protein